MADPKLLRLEFEYSDGTILRLTKAEALKWEEAVKNVVQSAHGHGVSMPTFNWEHFIKK